MKTAVALDVLSEDPDNLPLSEASPPRRPCVVLAEDDREMRMLVATTLRRAGWDVIEARDDGTDCVIVSDIRMPGMSGLDALERLRDIGWVGGIILITAFGDEATHARAHEMGANTVLDKPFD